MKSTMIYLGSALLMAAVVAALSLAARPAAAATDVSGDWDVTFALSCTGNFTQTGSSLAATVDCGADIAVDLTGTYDATYRTFSLTGDWVGFTLNVQGSVSTAGDTLSGTWSAPPIVNEGPFSAARNGAGNAMDISGSWGITVENIFAGHCSASIDQQSSQLSADVACDPGPVNVFDGTVDVNAGTFSLSGPFNQFTSLAIEGTVSDDGASFVGTWFIDPVGPGGLLTGERVGGAPEPTATRVRAHPTATAAPAVLPTTGSGASSDGPAAWAVGAIAAALALSGASYFAFRRVR